MWRGARREEGNGGERRRYSIQAKILASNDRNSETNSSLKRLVNTISGEAGKAFKKSARNLSLGNIDLENEMKIHDFEDPDKMEYGWPLVSRHPDLMGDLFPIDSVLPYAMEFLDSKSLAMLCNVNSAFLRLGSDPKYWIKRLENEMKFKRGAGRTAREDLKSFLRRGLSMQFVTQDAIHPKDQYAQEVHQIILKKNEIRNARKMRNSERSCHIFHELTNVILYPICTLTFAVLLGTQLGKSPYDPLPWKVFIPMILYTCYFIICYAWNVLLFFTQQLCGITVEWLFDSNTLLAECFRSAVDDDDRPTIAGMSFIFFCLSCLLASIILLMLKTTETLHISYFTVVIPLLCAACLLCCAPFALNLEPLNNESLVVRFIVAIIISVMASPFWITPLLITLKLDGTLKIATALAFIPFFIADLVGYLVSCVGGPAGFCLCCCLFAPFLAFEIMLSARNWDAASQVVSIKNLFIPLYVGYSMWLCFGLVFCFISLFVSADAHDPTQVTFNRYILERSVIESSQQEEEDDEENNGANGQHQVNVQELVPIQGPNLPLFNLPGGAAPNAPPVPAAEV